MEESELSKAWRDRIRSWQESGKSVVRWCKEHDLPDHQFYYWKSRLIGKQGKGAKAPAVGKFIELQHDDQAESGVVIQAGGVQLRLSTGFDENTLIRCLQALGGSA